MGRVAPPHVISTGWFLYSALHKSPSTGLRASPHSEIVAEGVAKGAAEGAAEGVAALCVVVEERGRSARWRAKQKARQRAWWPHASWWRQEEGERVVCVCVLEKNENLNLIKI